MSHDSIRPAGERTSVYGVVPWGEAERDPDQEGSVMGKNYGLTGGDLDGEKHRALAADPVAYMRRLSERPWMAAFNRARPEVPSDARDN
jgi:hypothetical protein